MSVSIEDLKPKSFAVTVKGLELTCKPLRLSHALSISKIGEVFQNPKDFKHADIKQAEADMDTVIGELIPELKDTELDITCIMELITQMMEHIQPSDNKELEEKGVKIDSDPKAGKTG